MLQILQMTVTSKYNSSGEFVDSTGDGGSVICRRVFISYTTYSDDEGDVLLWTVVITAFRSLIQI